MVVALSGSTGFIGHALLLGMREAGWQTRILDRHSFTLPDKEFTEKYIDGADAVINLAGAPIFRKWTPAGKQEITDSRVNITRRISGSIIIAGSKPAVYISASAIGIYDTVHTHTEDSADFADSFLANVCCKWESEALHARDASRVIIFRFGVVLGKGGGALQKMYIPFSIGMGGKIGNGQQPFSFIHIRDLVNAIIFAVETPSISGIVNAVSPYPSDNAEFTDKLGKVLGQPTWLTIPVFALKMRYGEVAQAMVEGQRVLPGKLLQAGFRFKFPTIQNALVDIYG